MTGTPQLTAVEDMHNKPLLIVGRGHVSSNLSSRTSLSLHAVVNWLTHLWSPLTWWVCFLFCTLAPAPAPAQAPGTDSINWAN